MLFIHFEMFSRGFQRTIKRIDSLLNIILSFMRLLKCSKGMLDFIYFIRIQAMGVIIQSSGASGCFIYPVSALKHGWLLPIWFADWLVSQYQLVVYDEAWHKMLDNTNSDKQKQCSTSTSAHVASVMKFGFSLSVYLWESVVVRFVVITFIPLHLSIYMLYLLLFSLYHLFRMIILGHCWSLYLTWWREIKKREQKEHILLCWLFQ
jgi:hypothetical protein